MYDHAYTITNLYATVSTIVCLSLSSAIGYRKLWEENNPYIKSTFNTIPHGISFTSELSQGH